MTALKDLSQNTEVPMSGIKNGAAVVTALPGSPADGDIAFLQTAAMAAKGIVWQFRFRSGPADWEFVGGPWWHEEVPASEACSSTSYVDITTVGPQITTPLAAEYEIEGGAVMWRSQTGTADSAATPKFGAAATAEADRLGWISIPGDTGATLKGAATSRKIVRQIASGTLVKMQYRSSVGSVRVEDRWLAIRPIRTID